MLRRDSRPLFLLLLILLLVVVAPVAAIPGVDLTVSIVHSGNAGASNSDFLVSSTGTVTVTVTNIGTTATASQTVLNVTIGAGLSFTGAPTVTGASSFACNGAPVNHCTIDDAIAPGPAGAVTLAFPVQAAASPGGPYQNSVGLGNADETDAGSTANDAATDPVAFRVVTATIDLSMISVTHTGNSGANFLASSTTGTVSFVIQNLGTVASSGPVTVAITLGGGLTFGGIVGSPIFGSAGDCTGTNIVTCSKVVPVSPGTPLTTTFRVNAPSTTGSGFTNSATVLVGGDANNGNNTAADPTAFSIVLAGTQTPTSTTTMTPFPTFPIPTFTVAPTLAAPTTIPTATFIPPPPTNTPLPRPANAGQAVGPVPHPAVTIVVDRDGVNVRSVPAIGAEVVVNVNAGFSTNILARSGDGQWVEVKIGGQLGWIGTAVLAIVSGDINSAPVADPRTIPWGGFENPRAGLTSVTSQNTGKLDNSGLRVRSGPGSAFVVLANAPRYTIFSLLGRTDDNLWLQVNFEGTLGWVATEFVDMQQGLGVLNQLPVDGIVADALTVSSDGADTYTDTLKLMLSRVELAQPSLDSIRGTWTNIALGGRVQCANFPARPTDFNIPNPVLAPFYATLFPLDTDFNSAMTSLRQAIDLFITICGQPQPPAGFVGQPVVQNALDAINQTDALFASLRQRLTALLPAQGPIDNNTECEFTYQNRSQVVPRLVINQVQIAHLTKHDFVLGFCFDAGVGQSLKLEALKANGNADPRLTISSFDNATNFIGTAEISDSQKDVSIQPILITQTDRYILILADLDGAPNGASLDGNIALLLTDATASGGLGGASLGLDANGNVIVNQGGIAPATPLSNSGVTPGILGGSSGATATPVATRTDLGLG